MPTRYTVGKKKILIQVNDFESHNCRQNLDLLVAAGNGFEAFTILDADDAAAVGENAVLGEPREKA
jgi:hypothetical protein